MSIGRAIRLSRQVRGLAQSELAPYGQAMVAKVESGQRRVARDVAPELAAKLDHPALFAELAREITGFGPAWLDGERVDLHRAVMRAKCLEELREAMEAMDKYPSIVPPGALDERERKAQYEHLMQVMDAIEWAFMYVGVQCLEYGFSMLQLGRDHYKKMQGKRYVAST